MSRQKTSGSFQKVRKLIAVLQKCNGKATIGNKDALISPKAAKILAAIGVVLLVALLAAVAFLIEPLVAPFVNLKSLTQTLMLVVLLLCFTLSIKNIVTVLYTADDLSVLLPMPFSAGQIVTAKLAVSLQFPLIVSIVAINTICIGFGLREAVGAVYFIGAVLSSILIPLFGLSIATFLVVIVFRVFGFIRNRDITVVLGGLFTLALTVGYIFVSNRMQSGDSAQAAAAVSSIAAVAAGFPNISFMCRFMFEGDFLGLVISLAVTAAALALAMLAVKLFYLSTALSMQNTGTNKKKVTKESLGSKTKVSSLKALTSYESKHTRRNPAYLVYGFAMSFIWPVLFIVPFLFGKQLDLDSFKAPIDMTAALICAVLLGVTASCFSCGFNVLPATAFTREGRTFEMLKTMPIDFREYYKSKRNFSMLICSLGSVLYVVILGVVCLIMGILTIESSWVILFGALVCFMTNLIFINAMLLKNAKRPNFDWDSETEFSRKLCWINVVAIVIGVIMLIAALVAVMFAASGFSLGIPVLVSCVVIGLGIVIAGWVFNRSSVKKGAKRLTELD